MSPTEAYNTRQKRRRWWIAAILAIVAPVAAYLYVGRPRRATAAAVLTALILLAIRPGLWDLLTYRAGFLIVAVTALLSCLVILIDVLRIVIISRRYVLRRYNRVWIYAAILAVGAVASNLVTATPSVRTFSMESTSNLPTLAVGERMLADMLAYRDRAPMPGDMVIFRHNNAYWVKRLVAGPGDTVQMKDGILNIDGHPTPTERVATEQNGEADANQSEIYRETLPNGASYSVLDLTKNGMLDNTPAYEVPDGTYFMLGDNRDNSTDSRVPVESGGVGYVPRSAVLGKVLWLWWSPDRSRIGKLIE